MKLSQFKQLIREEVRKVIKESSARRLNEGFNTHVVVGGLNTPAAKQKYNSFKKQIDALVKQGKLPSYTEGKGPSKKDSLEIGFSGQIKSNLKTKLQDMLDSLELSPAYVIDNYFNEDKYQSLVANLKKGFFQFDPKKVGVSGMKELKKDIEAAVKQGLVPKLKTFQLVTDGMGVHTIEFAGPVDVKAAIQLGIYKQGQRNPRDTNDNYGEPKKGPLTAQERKDFKRDVMDIYKAASKGQDMTDNLTDELGDYFDQVQATGDKKLINAYELLRGEADGSVAKQAKYAKALLDLLK